VTGTSSARFGTAGRALDTALSTLPATWTHPVNVLAHSGQRAYIPESTNEKPIEATIIEDGTSGSDAPTAVLAKIQELMSGSSDISVRVFTFDAGVKHLVESLKAVYPGRVDSARLAPPPATASWDSSYLPEDYVVDAVRTVLERRAGGSINKTDLRQKLETLDERFGKDAGGYAALPGFISKVVGLARARGMITTEGEEPRIVVRLVGPAEVPPTAAQVAPSQPAHDALEIGAPDTRSTSQRYLDSWREAKLGSFPGIRTAVYMEMDRLLAEDGPKPLKALVNEAVRAVRRADSLRPEKFPWARVRLALESLMRRRPVAISDGGPVALSFKNGDVLIDAMEEDWQSKLDGELILHLIDEGFEITLYELDALTGALYATRDEDAMARTYDVVARLAKDGLTIDGTTGPLKRPPLAAVPRSVEPATPITRSSEAQ
jgi:hypothetical protein